VHPDRLTRRQALKLGLAGVALGAVRPAQAAASGQTESFSMALDPMGAVVAAAGRQTTRVFRAPRRFDLIGLGWNGRSPVRAEVRARKRGGPWSAWVPLHSSDDHGPDAGRAPAGDRTRRHGTDPIWTGPADEFQLRVDGAAAGLRARFVRSAPAARTAGRRYGVARSAAARRQGVAPAIIPRAAWGGDSVVPRAAPLFGQVQLAFVHHTATANDYGPEDSAAIVLGIARYHRDHNGWNDLGYNFLIDKYGQVFEGRAGGIDRAIVGAQAQGFNSVSTGVSCIGTFMTVAQTEAGMDALARLIAWKLSLHAVPVQGPVTVPSAGGPTNRFAAGTPVTFERIAGHRDGNATSCPGDVLYGQLADLRARAARYVTPLAAVTVQAASTRLRGSTTAVLSGTVRFPDGSAAAGALVDILYSTGGAPPATVATATCAVDGTWSARLDLPQTGTIRARFRGDAVRAPLESSSLTITILPRVSLSLSSRRIARGRRVAVSGVAWPTTAREVVILLERKRRGRYVQVRRRRVPLAATRYLRFLRPPRRGLYRVTVSVGGVTARDYLRVV
jgi:hypothetical protein